MSHNKNLPTETEDSEDDPIISKLKKTGCLLKHYAVLVNICLTVLFILVDSFHE